MLIMARAWEIAIACGFSCHKRVEPSISVKRNVTVPEGMDDIVLKSQLRQSDL